MNTDFLTKLEQVNLEIERNLKNPERLPALYKKQRSTVHFLSFVRNYLETGPSRQFCESELNRLRDKKEKIDKGFGQWNENTPNVNEASFEARKKGISKTF